MMLESSGFDFRNRYPQELLVKLAKHYNVDKGTVGKTAYNMSLDLHRTFAPLKQTTPTMAIACVELSARIFGQNIPELEAGEGYKEWKITRPEVMGLSYTSIHSAWTQLIQLCRNTTRPTRSLHSSSRLYNRWSRSCHRNVHYYPYHSEPRSFCKRVPSFYGNYQRETSQQRIQSHQWRLKGEKTSD